MMVIQFLKEIKKTGTTGESTTYVEKTYTGFQFDHKDEDKLIAGDGSTVVNAYFKRNIWTFTVIYWSDYYNRWETYITPTYKYGQSTAPSYNYAVEQIHINYPTYRFFVTSNTYNNDAYTAAPKMPNRNLTVWARDAGNRYMYTYHYKEKATGNTLRPDYTFYDNFAWVYFTIEDSISIDGYKVQPLSQWEALHFVGGNRYEGTIYYDRDSYNVTFNDLIGGIYEQSVLYQAEIQNLSPDDFIVGETTDSKGFIFQGWWDNCVYDGDPWDFSGNTTILMPAGHKQFFAKWEPPVFNVTLHIGDTYETSATYDTTIDEDETFQYVINEGETEGFLGWYWYLDDHYIPYDFNNPIYSDIDLYPEWGNKFYTVTYDLGSEVLGEAPTDSNEYGYYSNAVILEVPSDIINSTDKTFLGWMLNGDIYSPNSYIAMHENISFVAVWGEPGDEQVEISYYIPGIDTPIEVVQTPNSCLYTVPGIDDIIGDNPSPTGCQFIGFSTLEGGEGDLYLPGSSVAVDNTSANNMYASYACVDLNKSGVFTDEDGNGKASVGDKIAYTFTLKNLGQVDLVNGKLSDLVHTDLAIVAPEGVDVNNITLNKGETLIFTAEYTLTQSDIEAEIVTDRAKFTGEVIVDDETEPISCETEAEHSIELEVCKLVVECPTETTFQFDYLASVPAAAKTGEELIFDCLASVPAAATTVEELIELGFVIEDHCSDLIISSVDSDYPTCEGSFTRTYTIKDGDADNSDSIDCVITYNIKDDSAPELSCIGDQTVNTNQGVSTYTHEGTTWDATATDNCSAVTITYAITKPSGEIITATTLSGFVFAIGNNVVNVTAKDECNNESTCNFTVTVTDSGVPEFTISCADIGNQEVSTDAGTITYTHKGTGWDVTATDNDGIASKAWTLSGATTGNGTNSLNGVLFNMGTTTVFWDVTDNSGNTAECSFTVTVKDTEAPALTTDCTTIGNQTVNTGGGVNTYKHSGTEWDVTATDNDVVASIAWTLSGATTGNGTNSLDGVTFKMGVTTVAWVVTDPSGNTTECSYTVTVKDSEAPVLTTDCTTIGNQTVNTGGGVNTYKHSGTEWDVTATDNDVVASIAWTLSGATTGNGTNSLDGVTFKMGVTTVAWVVTDPSGNTVECSYTVTVKDSEAPALTTDCTTIGNQTLNTGGGVNTYKHSGTEWDVTATDNDVVASIAWTLSGATTGNGTNSLDGVTFKMGVTTVAWVVTDPSGNATECSYTVTVKDSEAPVLTTDCTTIGNQTVNTDGGVNTYSHEGTGWDVTATDNDVVASIAWTLSGATTGNGTTSLDGVTFKMGVTTVAWVVTDLSGNTVECSYTVTVNDSEAPVLTTDCTTIGNQTVNTDGGVNTYSHVGTGWDVTATDNDVVASIAWTLSGATTGNGTNSLDGVTFKMGVTTVAWVVTDPSGNATECSYTVTVKDSEAPVLTTDCTTIGNQTVNTDGGVNTYSHEGTGWDVTATDNDVVASIAWTLSGATTGNGTTSLDGVTFKMGVTTVAWVVTDLSGNTVECSYTVTVNDSEAPVLTTDCTTIGNQTVNTDGGVNTYSHVGTGWDVTATDNDVVASIAWTLSGATTGNGTTSLDGVTFNMGTTTVAWVVTDNSGNTCECSYTVTVEDNEAPEFVVSCTTLGDQEVDTDDGENTYSHSGTDWDVTARDNDGVASIAWELSGVTAGEGLTTLNGVVFNLGTTTVTWTITDNSGNTATCIYTITVEDNEAPEFVVGCDDIKDQTEDTDDGEDTYTHFGTGWDVVASDNDGIASITWELSGATEGEGETTLNNVEFNMGVTTVTWTITDNSGNTATCTYTVTVEDNEAPEFVLGCDDIKDQTEDTDDGKDFYTHAGTDWDVTARDNDGVTSIAWELSGVTAGEGLTTLNGVLFNIGTTTVTWTITDHSGNTSECSYTVTVEDNEAPEFVVGCNDIKDQTVTPNQDDNTYLHSNTLWDVVASDNDGIASITWVLSGATEGEGETTLNNVEFNMGVTTVTWTITDHSGNTSECSYTVTVEDNEAPEFVVGCDDIKDQTEDTDDGEDTYTHSGTGWDVVASDNDGIASITWELSGATEGEGETTLNNVEFNMGVTTVTWTITDNSGNTATCTYTITVEDNEAPEFVVGCDEIKDQTEDTDDGEDTYTHSGTDWDVVASDNDGVASIVWELSGVTAGEGETTLNGVVFNLGETTVTWTITDNSGNTSECSYTVTVNDNEAPEFIVSCDEIGDQIFDTDPKLNTYTNLGTDLEVVASDNDGIASITWVLSGATEGEGDTSISGVVFNIGETTVAWTVTDNSGNTAECSFTVIVEDTEDPEFVVSCDDIKDQTVTPNQDDNTYLHSNTLWDVVASDNDGVASIVWVLSGATEGEGETTLSGVLFNIGTTTVTWVITDHSGNTSECSYTVTVDDNEAPEFIVSCDDIGDQIFDTDPKLNTYTNLGTDLDVVATDNVGVISLAWTLSGATEGEGETTLDGVVFNMGVTIVKWVATDLNGNAAECSYTVTVEDNEAPVFILDCIDIGDQVVDAIAHDVTHTQYGTAWDLRVIDNDGIASLVWTLSGATDGEGETSLNGVVFNLGTTTVT
ncbi:MAG: beta strand repeat-containing protein [Bacteroidales bacterium]